MNAGLLLLLAVIALCSPQQKEREKESALFRTLGVAVYAVNAGDALSTEYGLSHYPNVSETNPLMRKRGIRIPLKVGGTIYFNVATAKLYRGGNRKTALWMRIAAVAAYSYVITHNVRTIRKAER